MSRLTLLHLSDTHLMAPGRLHQGRVDTTAALSRLLADLERIGDLDAVVVSGDVSDDGEPVAYERARALVEAFAAPRGAVVVWAMGNHDIREAFSEVLLGTRSHTTLDDVHEVAGFRVVVLDSSVPGKGYGHVRPEQLEWLRDELATPAPGGTLLVVHHPPVPAPTVLHEALALANPADLLDAVQGRDVVAILAGHYHAPLLGRRGEATVVVAPGVANRNDVLAARGTERAVTGSGAFLVEIDGSRQEVTATLVPPPRPDDGEELFVLDAQAVQRIAAESGPPR